MGKPWYEIITNTQIGVFDYIENPPHLHKEIELVCLLKGKMSVNCEGKVFPLSVGDFCLIMPNQAHYYTNNGCFRYLYLVTDTRRLNWYNTKFKGLKPNNPIIPNTNDSAKELFTLALNEYENSGNSTAFDEIISALLYQTAKQCNFNEQNLNTNKFSEIFNYINQHYKEDLSLETLARALYINKYYLSHLISDKLKLNFRDYINQLRIDEALRLIEQKNAPISTAALSVGFSNVRTFNRAFLKRFNTTPKKYLENFKK